MPCATNASQLNPLSQGLPANPPLQIRAKGFLACAGWSDTEIEN